MITLIVLQFSRTYLPALVCSSHSRRPPWKYLVLVLRTMLRLILIFSYFQIKVVLSVTWQYQATHRHCIVIRIKWIICDCPNFPWATRVILTIVGEGRGSSPSWRDAPCCRGSGTAWTRGRARRRCSQCSRCRRADSNRAPRSLREPWWGETKVYTWMTFYCPNLFAYL